MKRTKQLFTLLFCILLSITCIPSVSAANVIWPAPPDLSAPSAIVVEADTGAILYEKDSHARNYPASITKILTTLLGLENSSLNEIVTFSYDSVHKVEGSQIGIDVMEQLTMEQCLYGIMLESANEVSYAVAEHVGGSIDGFVAMMNEKAKELGCTDTQFRNPHGLPDENHYTTAYDMALIAQAAYSNPVFRTIVKTKTYTIPPTNITAQQRPLSNHHKMLFNSSFRYDGCTGGKTGYTNAARNTLVTFAEKNGMKLICVIMRDDVSNSHYVDTTTLLNYTFQNFYKSDISGNALGSQIKNNGLFPIERTPFASNNFSIYLGENTSIILPNGADSADTSSNITYLENKPGKIADINYTYQEHFLGKVTICYDPALLTKKSGSSSSSDSSTQDKDVNFFKINIKIIGFIILGIVVLWILLFLLRYIFNNYVYASRHTIRRRRRKKRRFK